MASRSKKHRRTHAATAAVAKTDPGVALRARAGVNRAELKWIAAIVVAALIPRLIAFFLSRDNPLVHHPILDGLYHREWALDIISGNFRGNEVFFRAPLYPYFLAALYKVSNASNGFAVAIQHLIGIANVVLVYLLARCYFAPRVAIIAGVVAALYWPFMFFEGELLIVTVFMFVMLLALWLFASALQRGNALWYALAGATLGLAALTRPSILVMVPLVPLVIRAGAAAQPWKKNTAIVLAATALTILPVTIRNYVVGHDVVVIASQGGVNFYIGNNPQSNGTQAIVPGVATDLEGTFRGAATLAERESGRPLKPSQVSNYYLGKGLRFFADDFAAAATLTGKKFYFFWSGPERSNTKYIQFFWKRFGLGKVPLPGFWLVAPFALTGAFLLWPQRRRLALLYSFTAAYAAGVIIFFVNARFRLPIAPIMIIFAAYAMCYLWAVLRGRQKKWATVAVLVVSFVVIDYDFMVFRGVRAIDEAISHFELANGYYKMGHKAAALQEFERTRAVQEQYPTRAYENISPTVDYYLGTMYFEKGLYSRAIPPLQRAQRNPEAAAATRLTLAESYAATGHSDEALAIYLVVIEQRPDDRVALLGATRVYYRRGQIDPARQMATRLRRLYPGDAALARELDALTTAP